MVFMERIHLVIGNWTMAGVWVPYWTCISEAGFDIPAVLFLADPTLGWPMVDANSVPIVKKSCSAKKNEKEMLCMWSTCHCP